MQDGSITHWIERVKTGRESVAEKELWDRFFSRLVGLARRKLDDLPPNARDEEDIALSVMKSFFLRARRGDFPQLHDRTELWRLLTAITIRKSIDRRRRFTAHKNCGGRGQSGHLLEMNIQDFAASEPSPEMITAVNEECQRLMGSLSEELRQVARLKLEGYTNAEIAKTLGRVERTIERRVRLIRRSWVKGVEAS